MIEVLKVVDLQVWYGPIHAIKGVNFHINKGEIVSLIGANGAGKSSILRALSGIVDYKGLVKFNGIDLSLVPDYLRVGLGLAQAPEGRGIFPQLTVLENLKMGAYLRKDTKINSDLDHCFDLFPRLKERTKQMAGTLSGGEQQMLAISRALMAKPKLLLLDEPSLGLAPIIVSQIFEIIKKVNQEGVTILLVEQNARLALKNSNRAYCIETGLITIAGTGTELLHDKQVQRSYLGM